MPPTPQSSFVFDTQAWSSMASQLSVMALGREAAKTAAHYGGGREVPAARGITRSKSSDFLEQTLDHDTESRREAPARRAPAVTAKRSKSLYVPKSKSKKNNLGVDSTPGGEEKCTIHPEVKLRRNRCPRCAAGEMVWRKSSGSLEAITAILDESQEGQACQTADKENYVDAANELNGEEEIEEVPLDEKWAKVLQETRDADVVEEVSLDDKWADALRMISQRLANQKSEESGDEADDVDGRQSFTDPFEQDDNSPRASVEEGLDDRDFDPYSGQELHSPSRLTINELKETIERAYAPPNAAEYEDEVSQSSLARGTKVFAESKGRPQAPRGPLSSPESELLEGTEVMLPRDDSSVNSYHSSGSESSVTLSIESEYTMETYNSLTAPPVRVDSLLPPARSNETYRSPTSVQNVMRSYHNRDEEDSVEEDEEDEDFESSFIMSGAKTYSETKASTSLNSANNALHPDSSMTSVYEQLNNSTSTQNEQIIVEDVADESDDEEAPAPAQRESVPTSTAAQVIVEDVTESDEEETVAAPTPSKSTSSSKPVTPIKPRPTQRSRSRSKSRSRNLETGKTEQPTRRKSQPSFFSALVHNSRSRSQSRQRRSSSRSKSRTRTPVEDIQDGGGDEEADNVAPSNKTEQPTRRKSQPSFFSALVHNSRSRSSSRARKSSSRSKSRGRGDGGMKEEVTSKRGISTSNAPAPVPRREEPKKVNPPVSRPEVAKVQESAAPAAEAVSPEPDFFSSQGRGPITHPNYKLGDQAREEDMLVLPTHKPRKSRSRRRRRTVDSSSSSDSEDEEEYQYRKPSLKVDVRVAIGQLRHLDAAFVKRSDGTWTYALVADGDDNQIRFVVNDRGSTKSYPAALWKSCIRRIRVLTPRQGDRFAINTESNRKKRTLGRARSFRGKGKGRFVSPSPTRRNVGVLNLPPTIMEEREYNH